jgi:hypothetical protein
MFICTSTIRVRGSGGAVENLAIHDRLLDVIARGKQSSSLPKTIPGEADVSPKVIASQLDPDRFDINVEKMAKPRSIKLLIYAYHVDGQLLCLRE